MYPVVTRIGMDTSLSLDLLSCHFYQFFLKNKNKVLTMCMMLCKIVNNLVFAFITNPRLGLFTVDDFTV